MWTSATVFVVILACFVTIVESSCGDCKDKCCGKSQTCLTSCQFYSCDKDSECGDGCCILGYCTVPCVTDISKLHVGLIAGGSVFVFTTLASCAFSCIRRRCCRKKKDDEDDDVVVNVQAPDPHGNQPPNMPMQQRAMANQGYQARLGKAGQAQR